MLRGSVRSKVGYQIRATLVGQSCEGIYKNYVIYDPPPPCRWVFQISLRINKHVSNGVVLQQKR
jgi:hypothetical protein